MTEPLGEPQRAPLSELFAELAELATEWEGHGLVGLGIPILGRVEAHVFDLESATAIQALYDIAESFEASVDWDRPTASVRVTAGGFAQGWDLVFITYLPDRAAFEALAPDA